jgi:hypothetical protein
MKYAYIMSMTLVLFVLLTPKGSSEASSQFTEVSAIFEKHCYACHGNENAKGKVKVKGDLNLKSMTTRGHFIKDIELTMTIFKALEAKEMPTEKAKIKLDDENRQVLMDFADGLINEHLKTANELAPIVMRRMNRYEYNNAVKSLLQMRRDLYPLSEKVIRDYSGYFKPIKGQLPSTLKVGNRSLGKNVMEQQILQGVSPFAIDLQAEHGFNNRGDHLSLSPILMESFLQLSQSIVNSPQFNRECGLYKEWFTPPANSEDNKQIEVANERIADFLERAFRGAVDKKTSKRYQNFFKQELEKNKSFSLSMKRVVSAVLASPKFIYIVEDKNSDKRIQKISDYELATRMSFFLWSSIPDKALLSLAKQGQLKQGEVLEKEITRMLKDRKVKALAENFCRQWLQLDRLIAAQPDLKRHPYFYRRHGCEYWGLGSHLMIEPLLNFEALMIEDRSLLELVDSQYSYRTKTLSSWYDKPPTAMNLGKFPDHILEFHRVALTKGREGGVIFTAAAYTMNATPIRTSPITRGAWVATVVFNDPPKPPPDNIAEIEADSSELIKKGITLRQRLKAHQENDSCVACHKKIDPLGFVLENFDHIGRWRDSYAGGLKIDSSGTLHGKIPFTDIVSFKKAILKDPKKFIRAFSQHMLTYALGRELTIYDRPAIDKIVNEVMAQDMKFSSLIHAVIRSYPFQHKTNQIAKGDRHDVSKK